MNDPTTVETFWRDFLASQPDQELASPPEAWGFGDSPPMADELGRLVMAGIKTATCSALWEVEAEASPLPRAGDLSIVLDGAGQPLCLIETVEVFVRAYNEVDAAFAYAEGEGDRSLDYWRAAHRSFFTRTLPTVGLQFDETMPLVCERFRVVHRRPAVDTAGGTPRSAEA
jgi:uncharacterized protein YhfF